MQIVLPTPDPRLPGLVYVVDDWPGLLELYSLVLRSAGYEVRTFNNRAEALTVLLTSRQRVSLLITDYEGYPVSAEILMQYCRLAQPGIKILMASGYDESCLNGSQAKPDRFLSKPFSPAQLVAVVGALVGWPSDL